MVHTPSSFDNSQVPPSSFHIVNRDPKAQTSFMFQKISDPIGAIGMNRSPPHHFFLRLREFPPNLQDVLVVASSASTDIGLFSRSKTPLSNDKPADRVSNVFTMTEMAIDSRRAQLPMTGDLSDTSPIGLAFDLSSKEKVHKPIPTNEEIDQSPTPIPALMVLNNEGILASWWFVYSDSILQGTTYSGLVAAPPQSVQPTSAPATALASAFGVQPKPAFGASAFSSLSPAPAFATQPASAFGAPSTLGPATSAFGAPSGLGQSKSPWGSPAATGGAPSSGGAFGVPAFGVSTPAAAPAFATPAFGQPSTPALGLGNKASPWASGSTAPNAAFGQSGGLGKPASPFGGTLGSSGAPASSGFAAFASKGGFTAAPSTGGSIFGTTPTTSAFSNPATTTSAFGSVSQPASSPFSSGPAKPGIFGSPAETPASPFGKPATSGIFGAQTNGSKPSSGLGGSGFVLGSTFKADPSAKDDDVHSSTETKSSFFGGTFGNTLNEAAKAPAVTSESKDADMEADEAVKPEQPAKFESTTPVSTPAAPKTQLFPSSPPTSGGLFGLPSTSSGPAPVKPAAAGFSFGQPSTGGFSFANLNTSGPLPAPKTPTTTTPAVNPFSVKTPSSPKVKQEQVPETPAINKIPEAPLPPDTTSKAAFVTGDSSVSSVEADAPLPPDFLPKPTPKAAPPPFSLVPEKKPIPAELVPPSDVPGGPEDDGNSSGFLTEDDDEGDSEEGSGEDVTKDLSPVSEARPTPVLSPESSFGGMKTRSTGSNVFGQLPKPALANQARSLFGEVGSSAPVLPPPKLQQSPRSPSPIRNAVPSRMSRPEASRSVSAPGVASQLLGSQRVGGRAAPTPSRTFQLTLDQVQAEEKRRVESTAQREAQETKALEDQEDENRQKFLASDIQPTTVLGAFEVHEGSVSQTSADSVPAQVETVYRDINSMVDTLGTNARTLSSFIQGHTDGYKDGGREKDDLEKEDGWVLVEMQNLAVIVEKDLTRELEDGRVKNIASKIEACNNLQKDIIRLRAKHEDIKKIIDAHVDPDQLASVRAQPLTAEQSAQQNDLRRDFTKFQKLLSEAEDGLTLLKAKIVAQSASRGRVGGAAPTVEAVMRTITKMTSMAEKRSGDIDVLENQMRKLRFSSAASFGSREGSPFATPQKNNRASTRNPGTSSTYGLFYTPDSIKDTPLRFQSSVMSSTGSFDRSSSPRKKMSGFTPEDKILLRAKLAKKKEVTDKLKVALTKAGTRVRKMEGAE